MATSVLTNAAPFIVDPHSADRNSGRQIDWSAAGILVDAVTGKKYIPGGTVVGELLSGTKKISPRVVTTNPAIGILEHTAYQDDPTAAKSGYPVVVGGVIYENLIAQASGGPPKTLAAAIKTELAAAGAGFVYEIYEDNRS